MQDSENHHELITQELSHIAELLRSPEFTAKEQALKKLADLALTATQTATGNLQLAAILEAGCNIYTQAGISVSIDEHQRTVEQAEANFRSSEKQFRALFENAIDGIIFTSTSTEIKEINRSFAEMHGYTVEEMRLLKLQDLDIEDLTELVPERLRRTLNGEKLQFEVQHRHKDGHIITLEVADCLVPTDDENYVVSFHRDITKRKQAESALQESERRHRELINGMTDTAWVIGFDGKVIDVNQAAERALGYSKEELLTIGLDKIDATHDLDGITELTGAMPTDRLQMFETYHRTKNGTVIPVEIRSSIVNYQGQEAILCIARDITERKRMEAALITKSATFEATLEASSAGILVINERNELVITNRRYAEIFNVSSELLENSDDSLLFNHIMSQIVSPDEFHKKVLYLNAHPQEISDDEITLKNGLVLHRYSAPVLGTDGKYYGRIWTFHDITNRKLMEENLREASIRNPLTGLYNRRHFEDKVTKLEDTRRRQYPISVIYIDIDGLKIVNDTKSHKDGDELIKRVGEILKKTFRPEDFVAHWGGDEFAVLAEVDEHQIPGLMERLKANVVADNQINPELQLSISAGTATAIDGSKLKEAITAADINMQSIKDAKGASRKSHRQ